MSPEPHGSEGPQVTEGYLGARRARIMFRKIRRPILRINFWMAAIVSTSFCEVRSAQPTFYSVSGRVRDIAVGDLYGDGLWDIAGTIETSNGVSTLHQRSDGGFDNEVRYSTNL